VRNSTAWRTTALVVVLLLLLVAQLARFVSRQSQTWDEGDHLYAGYRSLTQGDFGLNPEHPPLAKMVAALPLLRMNLRVPPLQGREFKQEAFLGGRDFVFGNDADTVLFRARMAASVFTVLLALFAFLAAREMFGTPAGLTALVLVVFDPNVLAHGALVTTDAALSCWMLATVYAFYRYVRRPSAPRLLLVGLAAGLALASKHTGLLVLASLGLLAVAEWLSERSSASAQTVRARALRLAGALLVIGIIAVGVLWAFYGFRYAARPEGLTLNPPASQILKDVPKPHQAAVLGALAHWRLLPESYLCGLADVFTSEAFYRSYLFGKAYPHGVWFYFPAAFLIKSTLAFVALPCVVVIALATRRLAARREIIFLAVPSVFYFLVAVSSKMNIGARHILPVYPFLAVAGAGALWALAGSQRKWMYATFTLLAVHVASSLHAFPSYIAYSNEIWGGPTKTYKYLSDSNSDWAQQLKSLKRYLDARGTRDCWFAYFGDGTADVAYYGIRCRPLPTVDGFWFSEVPQVPAEIDGTVIISAGVLSGFEVGPGQLHPYGAFETITPTAEIDGGLFVYDGHFQIPLASAMARAEKAEADLGAGQTERALAEAHEAIGLAPTLVKARAVAGDALSALGRKEEAVAEYAAGLNSALTIEPAFQVQWVEPLRAKLAALAPKPAMR
jgi:Dolichyl-phosphate-mannose-protein mannosyltransferase